MRACVCTCMLVCITDGYTEGNERGGAKVVIITP